MKIVQRIDTNGYYIEDVFLSDDDEIPPDCVSILYNEGLYKPQWNGLQWVEGLTQDEINAIKNQPVQPDDIDKLKDRISALEDAFLFFSGI